MQRRLTKLIQGLFNVTYLTKLVLQNLKLLEECRLIKDIILVINKIRNLVDLPFDEKFSFNTNNTHGHSMKFIVNYSRLEFRWKLFSYRCIDVRNNKLTKSVTTITLLGSFKKAKDEINYSNYCRGRDFDI